MKLEESCKTKAKDLKVVWKLGGCLEIQYGLMTNAGDRVSLNFFQEPFFAVDSQKDKMTLLCLCVRKSVNFCPLIKITSRRNFET
jgi:hypothetical protein